MDGNAEPILDVVRGLSTVASVSIFATQVKNIYATLYRSKCKRCRGAGTIICRHCHGTKIRRTYPVQAFEGSPNLEHPAFRYECYHCGPYAMNDFDYDKEGDDEEAWNIMDNLKAAMANRTRPHRPKATAGTVPCPVCYGQCVVRRHTPDFESLFRLDGTWIDQIARKNVHRASPLKKLDFAEEILVGKPPKKPPVKKKLPNIRGIEGRSMDEVILPYVDDSDTTESSDDEYDDDDDDEF